MTDGVDEAKIDILLERSIDTIYPSKETLKEKLLSGEKLRMYVGIDPTNTYVHLGHSTNYLILRRFHELGHKIIVLIGDFTATIGDPSDKSAARQRLTQEEVQENLQTFKEQIGKILDFKNKENLIEFKFNSEWLKDLNFEDAIELASNFTVQQMIQRDTFEKRLEEEKPLYVHEFFYPLMQGYDSVALEADVEIGGTDQTFNMLAGRTLLKRYKDKDKFVITTTLLENPKTGEKLMSKSQGTGVGLDLSPFDMYGKIMALPDEGVIQCFIDCTTLSLGEIEKLEERIKEHPRDVKMKLAYEIVSMYHSKKAADSAQEEFISTFKEGGIPDDIETVSIESGTELGDILNDNDVVSSKTQFRRLVDNGAINNMDTDEKITDYNYKVEKPLTVKVGKRRFLQIEVE